MSKGLNVRRSGSLIEIEDRRAPDDFGMQVSIGMDPEEAEALIEDLKNSLKSETEE